MPLITKDINLAQQTLKQGKPVAIPTETVYGLAAMINNEQAINAVFTMKNRPLDHPLIIHVAKDWDLNHLVTKVPNYGQILMEHFWPGPLTLIFQLKEGAVNPLINGGQSTVAIRCPKHKMTQELLKHIDTPIVAPSANPFGKISPTTAEHVAKSFKNENLLILDGGRCPIGIESTIVDVSNPDSYQILRHGLIDSKEIARVIKADASNAESSIRTPGRLKQHYQPHKPLFYFLDYLSLERYCQETKQEVYVIAGKKPATVIERLFHQLSESPQQAAFDLYYQLREADESSAPVIAIELPKNSSEWEGIRERVLKAGSKGETS